MTVTKVKIITFIKNITFKRIEKVSMNKRDRYIHDTYPQKEFFHQIPHGKCVDNVFIKKSQIQSVKPRVRIALLLATIQTG